MFDRFTKFQASLIFISIFCSLFTFFSFIFRPYPLDFIPRCLSVFTLCLLIIGQVKNLSIFFLFLCQIFSCAGDFFFTLSSPKFLFYATCLYLLSNIFLFVFLFRLIEKPFYTNKIQKNSIAIASLFFPVFFLVIRSSLPEHMFFFFLFYTFVCYAVVVTCILQSSFNKLLTLGGTCIILSHCLLAIQHFMNHFLGDEYIFWLFYFVGQFLIATFVCRYKKVA